MDKYAQNEHIIIYLTSYNNLFDIRMEFLGNIASSYEF